MSERLRLRSIRLDDALWAKVQLAANDERSSASQLVAMAVRAYVDGPQEAPGVPGARGDPPGALNAAPAPALLVFRPVRASDEPRALNRPDTCSHPAAARRGGVRVVRHCGDCGQPFGLTGITG
jgi:hypothetical protein